MITHMEKIKQSINFINAISPLEGINLTKTSDVATYKSSTRIIRKATVDLPIILVVLQGKKTIYFNDKKIIVQPGNLLIRLFPIIVDAEINEATEDNPLLLAAIQIDLSRLTLINAQLDTYISSENEKNSNLSSLLTQPLNDRMLDTINRLLQIATTDVEAQLLTQSVIDELYFRLLTNTNGHILRQLLKEKGQIQRLATAISYIHTNIDKHMSIECLADLVHMSPTSFFNHFKDIMHMTPLNYIKSIKLIEAQKHILNGQTAHEASYMVGYNSPSQFSREYKRYFGYTPSETLSKSIL